MGYTITKYAQSCFLIEKEGRRLLLDPGNFVYQQSSLTPDDWPKIDVIAVTHEHEDHADRPGILRVVDKYQCPVYTNASCARVLGQAKIKALTLKPAETVAAGGFHLQGVAQQHGYIASGPRKGPGPEDVGFIIDGTFYTPGDSVPLPTMPHADVLFVPITGPEMSFDSARQMIDIVRPQVAVPMHYSNHEKYPVDEQVLREFRVSGCQIKVLDDQEHFVWPAN